MNRMRKWIALLAAVVMLLGAVPVSARSLRIQEEDLSSTQEYQKLDALGLIANKDIIYETHVSRGEFFSFVVRMLGSDPSQFGDDPGESRFSDLDSADAYYPEIVIAERLGLIQGDGGGVRVQDNITWAEALKVLTYVLGWGEDCEQNGGFPAGYVKRAMRLDITDSGTIGGNDDSVTPQQMFTLLLNTLEADICPARTMNSGDFIQYTGQGENLLGSVFGLTRAEGVVDSNRFTALYGDPEYNKDMITIGDRPFWVGNTDAENLLGYYVEYYYKEVGADKTLVYAAAMPGRNRIITVDADDIDEKETTAKALVYYEKDGTRRREARLSADAALILNGGQANLTASNLTPHSGKVVLIDNDESGGADVALVTSYAVMRVGSVSQWNYTVTDALGGGEIVLDPGDTDYEVTIRRNGAAAAFADIKVGDVISYAASSGHILNKKHLEVSDQSVTGTLSRMDDDNVYVDDVAFEIDSRLEPNKMIGTNATFYLDFTGRIVDYESAPDLVYGYLNGLKDVGTMGHTYKAQIYTENNRWVELELASRVRINDESMPVQDAVKLITGGGACQQLIAYLVNEDAKVKSIHLAKKAEIDFQPWSDQEEGLAQNGVFRLSRTFSAATYRSQNRSFDGAASLKSSAKIFIVPEIVDGKPGDRKDFAVMNTGSLVANRRYTNVSLYNANKSGVCELAVIEGKDGILQIHNQSNLLVCDGMQTIVNTEGEVMDALSLWYGDESVAIPIADDEVLAGLGTVHRGDIVQCAFDMEGKIGAIVRRLNIADDKGKGSLTNGIYNAATFLSGTVYQYDADEHILAVNYGGGYALIGTGACKVYIYDTVTENLTVGTMDDVVKDDFCFIRAEYMAGREMIVYR